MYCDVAPGFNLKREHFLHLNRMEREKVTFRYIYDSECNGKGLARMYSTISVDLSYERTLRDRSVLKIKQSVVHRQKKNDIMKIKNKKSKNFS